MKVQMAELRCSKCGHTWIPRKAEVVRCPECGRVGMIEYARKDGDDAK